MSTFQTGRLQSIRTSGFTLFVYMFSFYKHIEIPVKGWLCLRHQKAENMLAICFYDAAPINLKAVLNFDKGGRKVVSTN